MKNILITLLVLIAFQVSAQKKDTITTASGLKYVQVKAGTGNKPVSGSSVKVIYTGKLLNGKVFDSNAGDKAFKFKIDNKEVIPGWDEGFKLMKAGEKGILIVPAKLAYGKNGVKDPEDESKYMIPPNAMLIFEVELVEVK